MKLKELIKLFEQSDDLKKCNFEEIENRRRIFTEDYSAAAIKNLKLDEYVSGKREEEILLKPVSCECNIKIGIAN